MVKNIVDAVAIVFKDEHITYDVCGFFIREEKGIYEYYIYPMYITGADKKKSDVICGRIRNWLIRRGYTLDEINKMKHVSKIFSIDKKENNDEYFKNLVDKMMSGA